MTTMVETNNSPGTLAESGGGLGSSRVRTGFPQNFTNSSLNPLKKNNSLTKSNLTSTWNVGTSISNEYISEKNSNFTNPRLKSNLSTHISQQDIKKLQHEDQREKMRNQAYEKFEKLAKKKYGSVEGLFAAFKKDSSETLTLDELSEQLRKRNMDLYFPRDDQRLFFEKLDTTHSLKLPVSEILKHFHPSGESNQESRRVLSQEEINETDIKDLILSKIDYQRESSKLCESPRQTRLQLVRAMRNLDPNSTGNISVEQLRWAIGPEYLNLGLSEQEIQATLKISKGVDLKNNQINYSRFVGNLNIRNTDPICDPFFDRRANQITRLKQRLNSLNEFAHDPALLERRDELMKKCMVGPGEDGLKKYLDPSRPTTIFKPLSPSPLMRICQSQPSLSNTMQTNNTFSSTSIGRSFSNSPESTVPQESENSSPMQRISHHSIDTTKVNSDRNDSERNDHMKGLLENKIVRTGHFRATSNAPSRTYVKYPMTVDVRRAHEDHKEAIPGGKRHGPTQKYDGTMLHHNSSVSSSTQDDNFDQNERPQPLDSLNMSRSFSNFTLSPSPSYVSTNDEYFTPLNYQPSKPVSRPGVISDAMKCAIERENRRRKRYERTRANLQSFKDHAELEKISKALNDVSRSKGRVLESLQYELNAFHADLAVHHSRPLETMQRKPNPQLYKKMWGGNLTSSSPHDDRDFSTTYDRSFVDPASISVPDSHSSSKEAFPL